MFITDTIDKELADEFWEQVTSDYCMNTTFMALRRSISQNVLRNNGQRRAPAKPENTIRIFAVAWNAYYEGRELKKLAYSNTGEILIRGLNKWR